MAINKKLITFATRTNFDTQLANEEILNTSIVFIQDTQEIWTHGVFFSGKYSGSGTQKTTLKIGNTSKDLSLDGHTHSYLPLTGGTLTGSSYNMLELKRSSANGSSILFSNSSVNLGKIGFITSGNLVIGAGTATDGTANMLSITPSGVAQFYGNISTSGLVTGTGFSKTGATDAHVLLGSGGHKSISDFNASLVTSTTTSGTTNVVTSNTNTYLNIVQGGASVGSSTQIVGSNGVTVASDATGKLTITGLGAHAGIYSSRANGLGASSNSIEAKDTRSINPLPDTDLQRGVWFDFKTNSAIGLTGASTYSSVMTMVPYGDNSGNSNTAFRLAQSGNNLYFQNWTTVWGTWNKLWHSGNLANGNTSQYIRGDGSLATYSDTTYSVMPAAEASTGTATTARTISAKVLADEINRRSDLRYLPLSGGTLTGNLFIPNNAPIIQNQLSTSNYTTALKWYKGGVSQNTYDPQIGQHNTGGGGTGSIAILPYSTNIEPWGGTVGLFLTESAIKFNNNTIYHSGNLNPVTLDTTQTISGAKTFSSKVKILGSAAAQPLQVRGIVGDNGTGTIDDLYLQYGANKIIFLGNTAAHSISADGSKYTGDAATVGGLAVHTGVNNVANRIVRTDASGYIQAGWINTASGTATGTLTRIYCSQDAYLRYYTPAQFISSLNLAGLASPTFTGTVTAPAFKGSIMTTSGVEYLTTLSTTITAAAGWYRVFVSNISNASGSSVILNVNRNYSNSNNESYTFSINVAYSGAISITQLSGRAQTRVISKIRVDYVNSGVLAVDIYYSSASANTVYISGSGTGKFQAPVLVAAPTGTTVEFDTVNGVKSNLGFTGDLTGNAATASKVNNSLAIKFDTGTTEGTSLYTFDGATSKTIDIKAGSNVSISKAAGIITISSTDNNTTYNAATSSTLGLSKLFSDTVQSVDANTVTTTASRTYGVQVNSSGQMVVNVPWVDTNTTYSAANDTVAGLVKIFTETFQSTGPASASTTANRTYVVQKLTDANGLLVVNVPWVDTNTTYSLATTSTLGLVKLGSDTQQTVAAAAVTATASRSYAVQVNSSGQMVVNVPWVDTNTTYSGFVGGTSSVTGTAGLVPAPTTANYTYFLKGTGAWTQVNYSDLAGTVPTWNQSTTGSAGSVKSNATTGLIQMTGPAAGKVRTYTVPNMDATLLYNGGALGTPASGTLTNCTFPTLNQNTTGSANSLKSSATTGLFQITGPTAGNTRIYTLPDVNATLLYSSGALGTPSSGTLTNCTFPTLNQNTSGYAVSIKSNATTGLLQIIGPAAGTTRVMTTPNANFSVADLGSTQTFSGAKTFSAEAKFSGGLGVNQTNGAGIGISLYGLAASNPTYGLMFAVTSRKGTHGFVTGDWATYFTMTTTEGRGWIFTTNPGGTTGNVASISNTGKFYCSEVVSSGDVTAYSDISFKKNIVTITDAVNKVQQLRGVYYERKDYESGKKIGVIAQEIEKILPEVVNIDNAGVRSVAYGNIVGLLIEAIKEQQEEINNLKSTVYGDKHTFNR